MAAGWVGGGGEEGRKGAEPRRENIKGFDVNIFFEPVYFGCFILFIAEPVSELAPSFVAATSLKTASESDGMPLRFVI